MTTKKKLYLVPMVIGLFFLTPSGYQVQAQVQGHDTLEDNLEAYFDVDESTGVRVDKTTNNNDLSSINSVGSAIGINENAADFERSSGQYLKITDAAQTGLDFSTAFSANFWVKYETIPAGGGQWNFISKFLSTGGNRSYLVYANESGGTILFHFYESNNGSTVIDKSVTITPTTGQFYMYTVTYDGSTGEVKFYVDGSQVGSTQTGYHSSIYNGTAPFELGDVGQYGTLGHDGLMDEIALYSRVLTQDEITYLWNNGNGCFWEFCLSTSTDSTTLIFGGSILEMLETATCYGSGTTTCDFVYSTTTQNVTDSIQLLAIVAFVVGGALITLLGFAIAKWTMTA